VISLRPRVLKNCQRAKTLKRSVPTICMDAVCTVETARDTTVPCHTSGRGSRRTASGQTSSCQTTSNVNRSTVTQRMTHATWTYQGMLLCHVTYINACYPVSKHWCQSIVLHISSIIWLLSSLSLWSEGRRDKLALHITNLIDLHS